MKVDEDILRWLEGAEKLAALYAPEVGVNPSDFECEGCVKCGWGLIVIRDLIWKARTELERSGDDSEDE